MPKSPSYQRNHPSVLICPKCYLINYPRVVLRVNRRGKHCTVCQLGTKFLGEYIFENEICELPDGQWFRYSTAIKNPGENVETLSSIESEMYSKMQAKARLGKLTLIEIDEYFGVEQEPPSNIQSRIMKK